MRKLEKISVNVRCMRIKNAPDYSVRGGINFYLEIVCSEALVALASCDALGGLGDFLGFFLRTQ